MVNIEVLYRLFRYRFRLRLDQINFITNIPELQLPVISTNSFHVDKTIATFFIDGLLTPTLAEPAECQCFEQLPRSSSK
jgi:hypothetical protein